MTERWAVSQGPDKSDYQMVAVVWLVRYNKDQLEILCQQRSKYVDGNPLKWDASAGGHVNEGESYSDGVVREAKEEIGIDLDKAKLIKLFDRIVPEFKKYRQVFAYDLTNEPQDFALDEQEVAQVQWIPLADFKNFAEANMKAAIREEIPDIIEGINQWKSLA